MTSGITASIESGGYEIVRGVVGDGHCAELIRELGPANGAGRRGVLELPLVMRLSCSQPILDLVGPHMRGEPFAVRAIYFTKSSDSNWFVGWHQDLTIPVSQRIEVAGFRAWSVKNGVPHVQPPVEVLERMLTLRLHLDDADDSNGALRVLPGSHRLGRSSAEQTEKLLTERQEVVCDAQTGAVLLMRPLLLHASRRSTSDRERRVLHLEYASESLPGGLRWDGQCE